MDSCNALDFRILSVEPVQAQPNHPPEPETRELKGLTFTKRCIMIHGQVGFPPRLPAAGAGRAETDSRTGVKADRVIISTLPGNPAL